VDQLGDVHPFARNMGALPASRSTANGKDPSAPADGTPHRRRGLAGRSPATTELIADEPAIPAWPRVFPSAPLVRSCVLRWLGWDVASIERVSALQAHQRDVLRVEVVDLGAACEGRGPPP
jgi:hypothetical protein